MMSSIRRSLGVVAGASALLLVSGAFSSQAQEPARSKAVSPKTAKKVAPPVVEEDEAPPPKSAAKKKSDPNRRVYQYFAQLGLTEEQREAIYKIRAKHAGKIESLEKQLEDTRAQAMAEAEKVLTPAQKKLLEDRRKSAHAAAEAKADSKIDAPAAKKRRSRAAE